MNKEEFYSEISQYMNQLKQEFIIKQTQVEDALCEFHRVCEKYQIEYQVAFGSLLGLVRDGGQIPWDYDVDVIVKYSERKKLFEALQKELNKKYYVDCLELDPECESYKMRIVPVGADAMKLHVDVFFVVPVPQGKREYQRVGKQFCKYSKIRRYKTGKEVPQRGSNKLNRLDLKLHRVLYSVVTLKSIDKKYETLVNRLQKNESEFYMLADRWALYKCFPAYLIEKTKIITVQDKQFRVPEDIEEMLQMCYGNFKEYLPISARFEEWYRSCKHLNLNY